MSPHRSLTRDRPRSSRCDLGVQNLKIASISYLVADFNLWAERMS